MRTSHRFARKAITFTMATLLVGSVAPPVHAEDPIMTTLDASHIRDFIGEWDITMDMMGRKMQFALKVVDIDGKAGGTVDSAMASEPTAIENMSLNDDGSLNMQYEMSMGPQTFDLNINANLSDDGLEGLISEKSGLFEAPFTAVEAIDDPETRQQRRTNRRRSASSARLRFDQDQIRISFAPLEADSKDHESFIGLNDGDVFEYVGGRAAKILTDKDLHFGDVVVKQGNAHPTYPGVYSIWLQKSGTGWRLIFNEEADVWGTMYNAEVNIYDIPMTVSKLDEPVEKFVVKLEKVGDNGGKMFISWGDTQWSAEFTVTDPPEAPAS
ncbi:MAG: hypothetical protein COA73_12335 [Candidatus Hydrogenedentota bacterium]|nr:MAG: hypothetical protein COA73_12335 [Candidatus Hydrogenedentota bacterium]